MFKRINFHGSAALILLIATILWSMSACNHDYKDDDGDGFLDGSGTNSTTDHSEAPNEPTTSDSDTSATEETGDQFPESSTDETVPGTYDETNTPEETYDTDTSSPTL